MHKIFNEAFFNSPIAVTARSYLPDEGAVLIFNGIFSALDITEHLSHALTLETESVIFFAAFEDVMQLRRGQEISIEGKDYKITAIRFADGVGELQLCPM